MAPQPQQTQVVAVQQDTPFDPVVTLSRIEDSSDPTVVGWAWEVSGVDAAAEAGLQFRWRLNGGQWSGPMGDRALSPFPDGEGYWMHPGTPRSSDNHRQLPRGRHLFELQIRRPDGLWEAAGSIITDVQMVRYAALGADVTGTPPLDTNEYTTGDVVTVLPPGDLAREGLVFRGWSAVATGIVWDEQILQPDDEIVYEGTGITFYARWTLPGSGTPADPYRVGSGAALRLLAEEWQWFHDLFHTAADGPAFQQTADISLTGTPTTPIGSVEVPFTGSFDGAGHTITGLTITLPEAINVGLFGYAEGAQFSNMRVHDAQVRGAERVGILVGRAWPSTITNVHTSGRVNHAYIGGGLAGNIGGTSQISRSLSDADVFATANTSNQSTSGGLVGEMRFGSVERSGATGNITTEGSRAGGLVGYTVGTSFSRSFATGAVSISSGAAGSAGGFVGATGNPVTIEDSYALGTVSAAENTSSTGVGGFVGRHTDGTLTLERVYAAGLVTTGQPANPDTGGLVGAVVSGSVVQVNRSRWDLLNTAQGLISGATVQIFESEGLTPAEMTEAGSFTDWDFGEAGPWRRVEGESYPYLHDVPGSTPRAPVITGSGIPEDPLLISSGQALRTVALVPSLWDKHLLQTADIDLSPWSAGEGWQPIGSDLANSFNGTYDGDGHTITGLAIDRPGDNNVGLFGYAYGASFLNMQITATEVRGNGQVGVLAGQADWSSILNVRVGGNLVQGIAVVGGMAGRLHMTAITASQAHISVSAQHSPEGSSHAGGLVGEMPSASIIIRSHATGSVTGTGRKVGGFLGYGAGNARIEESWASGSVAILGSTNQGEAGGLVGGTNGVTISDSYATGSVSVPINSDGTHRGAGALVGRIRNDLDTVTRSWASGFVDTPPGTDAGGLVGRSASTDVTDSFWDVFGTGMASSAGGTGIGLSPAEMIASAQFTSAGWDFSAGGEWAINEGSSYPYLRNNPPSPPPGPQLIVSGSGAVGDPIEIASGAVLHRVGERPGLWDLEFKLISNIDLGPWSVGDGWQPIGANAANAFTGTFDGGGYTISGLTINRPTETGLGLFGFLQDATVSNLFIENASIVGHQYVGVLAGDISGTETVIEGVTVGSSTVADAGLGRIGVIAGALSGTGGRLTDVHVRNSTLNASGQTVGLFAGEVRQRWRIEQSSATGTVSAMGRNTGGFIGWIETATVGNETVIAESWAHVDMVIQQVSGNEIQAGGLVGHLQENNFIENSYARGSITLISFESAVANIGGLVGQSYASSSVVHSFAAVSMANTPGLNTHGILASIATVDDLFWDTDVAEINVAESLYGHRGRTTAQMQQQSTFTTGGVSWDFTDIWDIQEGVSYPFLRNNPHTGPD